VNEMEHYLVSWVEPQRLDFSSDCLLSDAVSGQRSEKLSFS
jgi:hypothetical protein